MKNIILISIIVLSNALAYSQKAQESLWEKYIEADRVKIEMPHYDSLDFQIAYRIWTSYQVVELIMKNDSIYNGYLINYVSNINRKEVEKRTTFQKIKIPDKIVKTLIEKLKSDNIETLRDCYDVEGYVTGLDGKTYVFEIGTKEFRRVYSYWEPEEEQYQNPEIPEVESVKNILNAINSEFNLWDFFVQFRDRLPKGVYSYNGVIMTVK